MFERPELDMLRKKGFHFEDPFEVVTHFEKLMASHYGASFGVAVDCCTHGLELALRYLKASGKVQVPKQTYPSVPMTLMKLGCEIDWIDLRWQTSYELAPYPIVDASLDFRKNSYRPGTLMCLSFQQKKTLPIGRGGMILTSDAEAATWLQKASYDGRNRGVAWKNDSIDTLGFHYYMTPEDAARGILLYDDVKSVKSGGHQDYPDISELKVFKSHGR